MWFGIRMEGHKVVHIYVSTEEEMVKLLIIQSRISPLFTSIFRIILQTRSLLQKLQLPIVPSQFRQPGLLYEKPACAFQSLQEEPARDF